MVDSFLQATSVSYPYGDREALVAELRAANAELTAAKTARASLAAERYESGQRRIDDLAAQIRTSTQENCALEAQEQMVRAHLKALRAMASSTCFSGFTERRGCSCSLCGAV